MTEVVVSLAMCAASLTILDTAFALAARPMPKGVKTIVNGVVITGVAPPLKLHQKNPRRRDRNRHN
jgi:hypothetical protein